MTYGEYFNLPVGPFKSGVCNKTIDAGVHKFKWIAIKYPNDKWNIKWGTILDSNSFVERYGDVIIDWPIIRELVSDDPAITNLYKQEY